MELLKDDSEGSVNKSHRGGPILLTLRGLGLFVTASILYFMEWKKKLDTT